MFNKYDMYCMNYAVSLAQRGLGRCAPNPSVGCIISHNERIVGVGHTADGGRPHAETLALEMAGERAKDATAYVTLEPCAHHAKTPPCAEALVNAGIKRVVIANIDPFPQVSGKGIKILESAGIVVQTGLMSEKAEMVNRGFFLTQTQNRPFVTLKTAISLDGKIALLNGQSQWITGESARQKVHQLRSQHDAIMVGINTVNHDDPLLTTRVDGIVHKAVRIVVDSLLRLPIGSKLVQSARNEPLWIVHASCDTGQIKALEQAGARLFYSPDMDLVNILAILAENGLTRILVEGGATLQSSFLKSGLYDQLAVFRASKIMGRGLGAFDQIELAGLEQALQFKPMETILLGQDRLEIYHRMSEHCLQD